jgi:hypothetical protein
LPLSFIYKRKARFGGQDRYGSFLAGRSEPFSRDVVPLLVAFAEIGLLPSLNLGSFQPPVAEKNAMSEGLLEGFELGLAYEHLD